MTPLTPTMRLLLATALVVGSATAALAQMGAPPSFLPGGLPPGASAPSGPGPSGIETLPQADAEANRRASDNYNAVIQDRPAFRAEREQIECAGIESLDLRAQCLATFDGPALRRPAPAPVDRSGPPPVTISNQPVRSPGDR